MNYSNISVSHHAKMRYIQRMAELGNTDIELDLDKDEESITNQIILMVDKGRELYFGPTEKNDIVSLIRNDLWLLLIDGNNSKVITLYYVNLGLGDDFSRMYLDQMEQKLRDCNCNAAYKKELYEKITSIDYDLDEAVKTSSIYEKKLINLKKQIEECEENLDSITKNIVKLRSDKDQYEKEFDNITENSRLVVNTLLQRQIY